MTTKPLTDLSAITWIVLLPVAPVDVAGTSCAPVNGAADVMSRPPLFIPVVESFVVVESFAPVVEPFIPVVEQLAVMKATAVIISVSGNRTFFSEILIFILHGIERDQAA
jgi:hypothetical protein